MAEMTLEQLTAQNEMSQEPQVKSIEQLQSVQPTKNVEQQTQTQPQEQQSPLDMIDVAKQNTYAKAIGKGIVNTAGFIGNVAKDTFVTPVVDLNTALSNSKKSSDEFGFQLDKIRKSGLSDVEKQKQVDMLTDAYAQSEKANLLGVTSALARTVAPFVGSAPEQIGIKELAKAGFKPALLYGISAIADSAKEGNGVAKSLISGGLNFAGAEAAQIGVPTGLKFGKGLYDALLKKGSTQAVVKQAEDIGYKIMNNLNRKEFNPTALQDALNNMRVFLTQRGRNLESTLTESQKVKGISDNSISADFINTIASKKKEVGELVGALKEEAVRAKADTYINATGLLNDIKNTFITDTGANTGVSTKLVQGTDVVKKFVLNPRTGLNEVREVVANTAVPKVTQTPEAKLMDELAADIYAKSKAVGKSYDFNTGKFSNVSLTFDDLYNAVSAFEERFNSDIMKRVNAGQTSGKPQLTPSEVRMYDTIKKAKDMVSGVIDSIPDVSGRLTKAKEDYKIISNNLTKLGPVNAYTPNDMSTLIRQMYKPDHADVYNAFKDLIPDGLRLEALSTAIERGGNVSRELATSANKTGLRREAGLFGIKKLENIIAASKQQPEWKVGLGDKVAIKAVNTMKGIGGSVKDFYKSSQPATNINTGRTIFNAIEKQVNSKK